MLQTSGAVSQVVLCVFVCQISSCDRCERYVRHNPPNHQSWGEEMPDSWHQHLSVMVRVSHVTWLLAQFSVQINVGNFCSHFKFRAHFVRQSEVKESVSQFFCFSVLRWSTVLLRLAVELHRLWVSKICLFVSSKTDNSSFHSNSCSSVRNPTPRFSCGHHVGPSEAEGVD